MEINNDDNSYFDVIKKKIFDIILKYIEEICSS